MNFRKPSKIQERALPLLMGNPAKNLVGQSQSGTGKTAAFVLNVLSRIDLSTEQLQKTPQALILAPTRELARQIVGVIQVMGQFLDGLIIGTAVPADTNARPTRLEASVVVGTPGTVQDMIKKRIMVPVKIKVIVLDEADNMLDQQGLGDQCIRVKALVPCSYPFGGLNNPLAACCQRTFRLSCSPRLSRPMCTNTPRSSLLTPTSSPCSTMS